MDSIPQTTQDVKQECAIKWCIEPVFRRGLCWDHFKEEVVQEWDAQAAEREASLEGVGRVISDPALDRSWWGYAPEEVYG